MEDLVKFIGVQPKTIAATDLGVGHTLITFDGADIVLTPPDANTKKCRFVFSGWVDNSTESDTPNFTATLYNPSSFYTSTLGFAPGTAPIGGDIEFIWTPGTGYLGGHSGSGFIYRGSILNVDGSISTVEGVASVSDASGIQLSIKLQIDTVYSEGLFVVYINEMNLLG